MSLPSTLKSYLRRVTAAIRIVFSWAFLIVFGLPALGLALVCAVYIGYGLLLSIVPFLAAFSLY